MGAAIFEFLIVYLMGFDWHVWVCFVFFFELQKKNEKYVEFQMDGEKETFWEAFPRRSCSIFSSGAN